MVWRNDFERRWYKLESVLGGSLSAVLADPSAFATELAVLTGVDSEDDALVIRNNNRSYYAHGFQSVLGLTLGGSTRHHIEAGVRYLEDEEDRFQQDDGYRMQAGRMSLTRPGAPGSQANRVSSAAAWAFFVQDRVEWGRLSLVPGFRHEAIDLARTDYARTDPDRASPTVRSDGLGVFVPGIGASLRLRRDLSLFAGAHKGFAPPGPGADAETLPEESVNYEIGLRSSASRFRGELTVFYNDYDNMLGRDTLAAGGSGSGDLFNAGKVRIRGLEAGLSADLGQRAGHGLSLPVRATYTLTHGEFRNSFESQYEPWGDVRAGDELPYLPRHQLFASVGAGTSRWLVDLSASYVARMRTRASQGAFVAAESTEGAFTLDLTGEYAVHPRLRLFASVQNLTDSRYIVSRHPAGARPGLPRTVMAGIKLQVED